MPSPHRCRSPAGHGWGFERRRALVRTLPSSRDRPRPSHGHRSIARLTHGRWPSLPYPGEALSELAGGHGSRLRWITGSVLRRIRPVAHTAHCFPTIFEVRADHTRPALLNQMGSGPADLIGAVVRWSFLAVLSAGCPIRPAQRLRLGDVWWCLPQREDPEIDLAGNGIVSHQFVVVLTLIDGCPGQCGLEVGRLTVHVSGVAAGRTDVRGRNVRAWQVECARTRETSSGLSVPRRLFGAT